MRIEINGRMYHTLKEAAEVAGLTHGTMRVYAQRKYFKVLRIGHTDLISDKALRSLMLKHGTKQNKRRPTKCR